MKRAFLTATTIVIVVAVSVFGCTSTSTQKSGLNNTTYDLSITIPTFGQLNVKLNWLDVVPPTPMLTNIVDETFQVPELP